MVNSIAFFNFTAHKKQEPPIKFIIAIKILK
jgi:hypothetical protein